MQFLEFLIEKRRYKDKNLKVSAYEQLKKYKDDPDIYISYTSLKKLGINPQSKWETPLAIYSYPLKEIWHKIEERKSAKGVPFAGDNPYIHIFKYTGKIQHVETYTDNDLKKDIAKINELYSTKFNTQSFDGRAYLYKINQILEFYKLDHVNHKSKIVLSDFKKIYFSKIKDQMFKDDLEKLVNTYNESFDTIDELIVTAKKTAINPSPFAQFWNITRQMASDIQFVDGHSSKNLINWNNILRKLGYSSFADKTGTGIIHPSEPIQTLFLSKKGIKVIDMILNKDYVKAISINTASDLEKHLPKVLKRYSMKRVFTAINKNTNFVGEYKFGDILTDQVKQHILENFKRYMSYEDKNTDIYVGFKLNDRNGFSSNVDKEALFPEIELYFNRYNGDSRFTEEQVKSTTDALLHFYGDLQSMIYEYPLENVFYNNVYSMYEWIYTK